MNCLILLGALLVSAAQETVDRLPDPEQFPTVAVPVAGRFLGLGRGASYAAAARGEIPTLRLGRKLVVPTAALRRLLELDRQSA